MNSTAALALLLLRPVAVAAPQDAGTTHDLRLRATVGEPVRVLVRYAIELENEMSVGEQRKKLPFRYASELEYVDEVLALDQPAAGDLDARRTYVKWEENEGEVPRDNELTGADVALTRRAGAWSAAMTDRVARETEMQHVLAQAPTVEWFELPEEAAVGRRFVVEPEALVALLLDTDDEVVIESTKGELAVMEVDEAGVARVEGTLMAATKESGSKEAGSEEVESQAPASAPAQTRATFQGTCALAVDTRTRRLRSGAWKGTARLVMDDETVHVDGKGTFDARVTVSAGAPAREALARRRDYRDVPRTLTVVPVAFTLPSHWFAADTEVEESDTFCTSLHGAEKLVTLEFRAFALEGAAVEETIEQVLAGIGAEQQLFDAKAVTTPLGRGRSVRFRIARAGDEPLESLLEFHPCGPDALLRVQLVGERKGFEAEFRNWQKSQRLLKRAE